MQSQVSAPSLRCLSVINSSGDITLNWLTPSDPSSLFTRYEIYSSPVQSGPYVLKANISTYSQTSYTDVGANGSIQAQYYYIVTVSSGTNSSAPSDTLRSLYLNLVYPLNGIVSLNWNQTHTPLLPSAATTYTLSREAPVGVWTVLSSGTKLNYNDTITLCNVNYNYKVETSDAAGCVSISNIKGGAFQNLWPPKAPDLDSISVNINGQATLGWEPSTSMDVTSYIIYKENAAGNPISIDTVYGYNNTFYTYLLSNAGSGSETYYVAARDSCGRVSVINTKQISIYLSSSYDLCSRTASLSWSAYGNLPNGILRYDVYCSINGGTYNLIGNSIGTTFSHSTLNPGDNYCYVVKVRNTDLTISANSNITCLLATGPLSPSYVYIRSVSVNAAKQVEITYAVDNTKPFKGASIFKSFDGVNFTQISFNSSTTNSIQVYTDTDVSPTEKNYYYKVQIADSCGNPGTFSNTSKTILLSVVNNNENVFYNTLTWDDYSSWSGGVASYNIYRAVNGVFSLTPIDNVGFGTFTYVDNVEDFVSDEGKFSYYVEAVEGTGNIYGFNDVARSNAADAYVEVNVFVPNAFAPKGLNSTWLPVAQFVEKTDYKVTVFDRWGTKIFQTTSDIQGWDGSGATDEVYVYLIEYKNARGEFIQIKGHLTMVR